MFAFYTPDVRSDDATAAIAGGVVWGASGHCADCRQSHCHSDYTGYVKNKKESSQI